MNVFGERLKQARKAKGLSVMELAERAGLTIGSIYRYESDDGGPTLFNVFCLAEELGVSIDWLVGRTDERTVNTKRVYEKSGTDFCVQCQKVTKYNIQPRTVEKLVGDKMYAVRLSTAICDECGGEMSLLGLIDKNIQEFLEQVNKEE